MAQSSRYRRRPRPRPAPQRPATLRTDYSEEEKSYIYHCVNCDLEVLRRFYPESVKRADRLAVVRSMMPLVLVIMILLTAATVFIVVKDRLSWWHVPLVQSVAFLYVVMVMAGSSTGISERVILRREADRRGVHYDKDTPIYILLNRVNEQYNATLPPWS